MRRRREAKSSAEVSSESVVSRRSSRRKKSPTTPDAKKHSDAEDRLDYSASDESIVDSSAVEEATVDENRTDFDGSAESESGKVINSDDLKSVPLNIEKESAITTTVHDSTEENVFHSESETLPNSELKSNAPQSSNDSENSQSIDERERERDRSSHSEALPKVDGTKIDSKVDDEVSNDSSTAFVREGPCGASESVLSDNGNDKCSNGKEVQDAVIPDSTDSTNNNSESLQSSFATDDTPKPARKRKWTSKKCADTKEPILAISTNSLKDLIAGVDIVPLSDIKFDSSSEVENSQTDREEGEKSPTPERKVRRSTIEEPEKYNDKHESKEDNNGDLSGKSTKTNSSSSNILFISNLVRPFTVLQLKGLLARTGKIMENGFWIDRIKSKCFVEYETEDQAIETRHALHGVRWPVSNPKCLIVEFGKKEDMEHALLSQNDSVPRLGNGHKENNIWNSEWEKEKVENDKKVNRPIREWDVGKRDSHEQEKNRDKNRDFDRSHGKESDRSSERDFRANNRENARDKQKRFHSKEGNARSSSPAKKNLKKENEAPIRLLDDLFRKTKTTPCIYWLPLTPEQIAEKELLRLKRVEEHKERVKLREMERMKERAKERDRDRDRDRERERDRGRNNERDRDKSRLHNRRNCSPERRRSRSRDKRRYL